MRKKKSTKQGKPEPEKKKSTKQGKPEPEKKKKKDINLRDTWIKTTQGLLKGQQAPALDSNGEQKKPPQSIG